MPSPIIKSAKDLVTSREAVCAGFLAQARAKGTRASPYVKEAEELWETLQGVESAQAAISKVPLDKLATAIGFSDKARGHFSDEELRESVKAELEVIHKRGGGRFREEILYRFLLTRGDTLGGEMRNITGALAQARFTSTLVKRLRSKGVSVSHELRGEKITRIAWPDRLLLFDRKPKLVGKNIDVILLKRSDKVTPAKELAEKASLYVACGELKGGIDPAGADEHWKTAQGALNRIRECFRGSCPNLFFAAAAIEAGMAKEIFNQLRRGKLSYAANLNVNEQVEELVAWLASL